MAMQKQKKIICNITKYMYINKSISILEKGVYKEHKRLIHTGIHLETVM